MGAADRSPKARTCRDRAQVWSEVPTRSRAAPPSGCSRRAATSASGLARLLQTKTSTPRPNTTAEIITTRSSMTPRHPRRVRAGGTQVVRQHHRHRRVGLRSRRGRRTLSNLPAIQRAYRSSLVKVPGTPPRSRPTWIRSIFRWRTICGRRLRMPRAHGSCRRTRVHDADLQRCAFSQAKRQLLRRDSAPTVTPISSTTPLLARLGSPPRAPARRRHCRNSRAPSPRGPRELKRRSRSHERAARH